MIYINISAEDLSRDNVAKLANEVEIMIKGWDSTCTDESLDILAEVIRTTTSLEKLVLHRDTVTVIQNDKVIDALAKNRTIKTLILWQHACGGNEGAKLAVAAILKKNSTIEEIHLNKNQIGVEGAKAIADALEENTHLETINLSSNDIGVEGAKAIADALKRNKTLKHIDLGYNKIGVVGAKAVADALKENASLQELDIVGNNIGEEGGKHILNALQQIDISAIENIYLRGNEISDRTKDGIKEEIIMIQNHSKSVESNEGQVTAVETTEDDQNASSSNEDEGLTTIHATNASQGDGSVESDMESNEARHNIMATETKMQELQSAIAQLHDELAQKEGDIAKKDEEMANMMMERSQTTRKMAELHSAIAQLHNELAQKQEEIASSRIQRLNGLYVGSDDLETYTRCCVCLEPYEEEQNSTDNQRLPIKSATCAHSLCEGCLDDYHASLMNGRSTLRYVRCPQCNDKTKKAFDIQNKVVDFFLREYIHCRKRKRST